MYQFVRGRRLLVLSALFLLPAALAGVAQYHNPEYEDHLDEIENVIIFYMIPQALVPLSALVLASGMIRDEAEGQTLTYLLIRPLPRPSIYLAKLLAAWCVTAGLATMFTVVTFAVVHYPADDFGSLDLLTRGAGGGAFRVIVMGVRRPFRRLEPRGAWILPLGIAYIVIFEGVFANIDFMVRRLTVLWYVRILAERWLGLHVDSWGIDLDLAPSGAEAFWTLLGAVLVLAVASAWLFGRREIRVKTPEGG